MNKLLSCVVVILAALSGCAEPAPSKVILGRSGWDLVALDARDGVVWRVPVAGVVKDVFELRGPGSENGRYYVASTGREHVRGGADVASILLFNAAGKRIWTTQIPETGPFPAKQLNATSEGMSTAWEVEGEQLYMHCSTGGLYPRIVSAFDPLRKGRP